MTKDTSQKEREIEELTAQRDKLADILTRTANALKGEPPELVRHSWHDLPEVASKIVRRKPLTHEQRLDLHVAFEPHKSKWDAQSILIDMVEAAHGIKGDA